MTVAISLLLLALATPPWPCVIPDPQTRRPSRGPRHHPVHLRLHPRRPDARQVPKCVKSTLKLANLTALIPEKACRKLIKKCENASICGKPNAAVCCVAKEERQGQGVDRRHRRQVQEGKRVRRAAGPL